MKILRAYTEAGSMGNQGFGLSSATDESKSRGSSKEQIKDSGDSIHLSPEAMAMLENGSTESLSVCTHDATYDQYGNITRQVDALRRDLANLAISAYPAGPAVAGKVNTLRTQINSLRASV